MIKNNYSKSNRKKGFTLLELIVVMAVSVIIIGVIYTFFIVNQKSLSRAEINSTLQGEAATIQKEINVIGAQGKGITSLNRTSIGTATPSTVNYSMVDTGTENGNIKGINITSLTTEVIGYSNTTSTYNTNTYTLYLADIPGSTEKALFLKNDTDVGNGKNLSNHVVSMSVTPLDFQMVATKTTATLDNTTGLQIIVNLHMKKGFSDITYPVTTIVNFRNKDFSTTTP